ncbi:MAG: ATP synthase F1 subunit delta [Proteobacteria bacterium]|nr:ATP synthase F1 subunit delta [Pseudomonadota bacterium]
MNIIQLKKIAQKYASALAELSLDEFVISELSFIENLVNQEKIVTFLRDPNIELKQKEEKLLAAISDYVSKPVQSLVLLLLKKNRANVLPFLCQVYKKIYYQAKGIVIVNVSAPTPLDSGELALLKTELERLTSKMVQFGEVLHDRTLLAGLSVTIDDRRIDFSMKTALQAIKKDLLANL